MSGIVDGGLPAPCAGLPWGCCAARPGRMDSSSHTGRWSRQPGSTTLGQGPEPVVLAAGPGVLAGGRQVLYQARCPHLKEKARKLSETGV